MTIRGMVSRRVDECLHETQVPSMRFSPEETVVAAWRIVSVSLKVR